MAANYRGTKLETKYRDEVFFCQPVDLLKVDGLLGSLLPRECGLCGLPSGAANSCAGCRADLPWIERPCGRCAAPLPADCESDYCGRCDIEIGNISFVHAALSYEYPVDRVITRAKFQRRPDCARLLGEWLAGSLEVSSLNRPDLVVPVPLHRRRLMQRGFNQAEEISRAVTEQLGLSHATGFCRRVSDTDAQSTLSGKRRRQNVLGAFSASERLAGSHVAIVDDVMTTGSTLRSLADEILAAGARTVSAWVVGRSLSGPAKSVVQ